MRPRAPSAWPLACLTLARLTLARLTLAGFTLIGLAGCGGGSTNVTCAVDLDCQSSLICVADPAFESPRCLPPCEEGTRLCDDGTVCVAFAGGRACYPGGDVGFGEPCSESLECEGGTVCPASLGRCAQACAEGLHVCTLLERCTEDDAVGGYCEE